MIFEIVLHKRIVGCLFCLFSMGLMGQTTLVSNQAGLSQHKSQYRKALGQVGGGVFSMYSGGVDYSHGFVLERYSEELVFEADRKVEAQSKHIVLRVACTDSFVFWLSVVKSKRMTYKFFHHRLGLDLQGDIASREIATISGIEVDVRTFETTMSTDKKAVGIFGFVQGVGNQGLKTSSALALSVDVRGELMDSFSTVIVRDLGVDDVAWASAEVSGNGNLALIYKDNFYGNALFNQQKDVSHFHFIHRRNFQTHHGSIELSGIVMDANVVMHANGEDFEIWGYWSELKSQGIHGHFRGEIDTLIGGNDSLVIEQFDWNDRDFKQLSGLMAIKKSSKPENYFIRDVIGLSHGGRLLISEQFYESRQMETYYVNGVPQTSSKLFFHYGDIALQYLGKDGALDSVVMIRKTQVGSSAMLHLFGFAHYVCAGSLNLVYNDDEGEINRVVHVKIDNNFVVQRDWLFRSDNIPGSIVPYEGGETDYCTLTLPIYRDKQWHWLQVISND